MLRLSCHAPPEVARRAPVVLILALAIAGVGSLAGCGASLDDPTKSGLVSTAVVPLAPAPKETSTSPAKAAPAKAANKLIAPPTPSNAAYKIGPQDVLEFSVFRVPELSKTVQVADSGTINLPLLGEVRAGGRTAQDLERELTAKLGAKYLQNPQVSVFVKEYNSQRVTIEGAVKRPGVYPIAGEGTLLQYIATAQGTDQSADSTVVVFRTEHDKRAAARFNIDEIRAGDTKDPPVRPGDVIVVGTSAVKETFNNILKSLPILGVFRPF